MPWSLLLNLTIYLRLLTASVADPRELGARFVSELHLKNTKSYHLQPRPARVARAGERLASTPVLGCVPILYYSYLVYVATVPRVRSYCKVQ